MGHPSVPFFTVSVIRAHGLKQELANVSIFVFAGRRSSVRAVDLCHCGVKQPFRVPPPVSVAAFHLTEFTKIDDGRDLSAAVCPFLV